MFLCVRLAGLNAAFGLCATAACGGPPAPRPAPSPVVSAPVAEASAPDAGAPRASADADRYCGYVRALEAALEGGPKAARRGEAEIRATAAALAAERGVSDEAVRRGEADRAVADRCGRPSLVVAAAVARAHEAAEGPSLLFRVDVDAALAEARRDRRPVFVVFCAEWSAACAELRRVVVLPELAGALGRVTRVWADLTDDDDPDAKALLKRFSILGVPTLIALDRDGREVGRESSLVGPDRLAALIARTR